MLSVEQIEEWLGQEVFDSDGERVGKLDEVFYSAAGEAMFASIKSGLLGRSLSIVPLAGASVGRDYVRLAYTAAQVEQAKSEVDVTDNLDGRDARKLGELYGVDVAEEDSFEGASTLNARRQAAEEARRRADELEEQARLRAAEAREAEDGAHNAEQDAAQKAERSEQARTAAEEARAEAERISQR